MKKFLVKPGFELIFSISFAAILALPPLVFGQGQQKDVEIKIENGDTTINGKNIKELSAQERHDALKDIRHLGGDVMINRVPGNKDSTHTVYMFKRRADFKGPIERMEFRKRRNGDMPPMMGDGVMLKKDSTGKIIVMKMRKPGEKGEDMNRTFTYELRDGGEMPPPPGDMLPREEPGDEAPRRFRFDGMMRRPMEFGHRNTQEFSFTSTGKDGMSTSINYRVSEPSKELWKGKGGLESTGLELNDLSLTPEFSSGKTTLMFNLPGKGAADVKFTDSEGQTIWTEKITSGSFSKKINIPLNGVYYLQVKQGGSVGVKRIVKE